jgi:1-acyl-sn-glycerol-3-phosphate acyltransferase
MQSPIRRSWLSASSDASGTAALLILTKVMQVARGVVVLLVLGVNTILLSLVLFVCAFAKLLAPNAATLARVRRFLAKLPVLWISVNNGLFALMRITRWDVEVPPGLNSEGCYAVVSNHQSWADILVLQRSFNRRLPFFRFFVKSSLIWLPILGQAWWALDMPFMKRHSKELLARRPELKGQDLENARKTCEKFTDIPVAMMNFPEGTRISEHKRLGRESSYRNLLEPRIGGIGQVFYALGEQLDALVDVTILYTGTDPAAPLSLWRLVSGQIPRVVVRARQLQIPAHLLGRNFATDLEFREELAAWVRHLWREKDELISGQKLLR